ncbi:hypothetical protein GWE18_24330 [Bradyrhizobium sp. CSA112]|uniref:hypothetical protein n=1 Tax=Bradyrhizobium sp. CSA112 TaxID=2699170 RepID=UPI0023AF6EB8|nr:hypothetical protein [Bradyrhizobium sp. CSA112]MDE5455907.1 hypothetical protein [Bradyrhizobium sp. CSA112]
MGGEQGVSGIDHVIDCVAEHSTFSDALAIVRKGRAGFGPGGTVVVGVAHRPAELDLRFIQLHGIAIKAIATFLNQASVASLSSAGAFRNDEIAQMSVCSPEYPRERSAPQWFTLPNL